MLSPWVHYYDLYDFFIQKISRLARPQTLQHFHRLGLSDGIDFGSGGNSNDTSSVTHVDGDALSGFSYDYDEEEDPKKAMDAKDEKKGRALLGCYGGSSGWALDGGSKRSGFKSAWSWAFLFLKIWKNFKEKRLWHSNSSSNWTCISSVIMLKWNMGDLCMVSSKSRRSSLTWNTQLYLKILKICWLLTC